MTGKLADVLLLEDYRKRPQFWVETEGGAAIPAPGETEVERAMAWARYREDFQRCIVAKDMIAGVEISTVFIGIDHNFFMRGRPLLYETMIFGPGRDVDEWQWRYATREAAQEGHRTVCGVVLSGADLDLVRVKP